MVSQLEKTEEKQQKALRLKRDVSCGKETFPRKLQRAAKDWRSYTKNAREIRKKMLLQYANGYFQGHTGVIQPMNLIDRYVNIIAPYLVSKNPKILVDAKQGVPASRSFARTLELALEFLFRKIRLAQNTLRPATLSSLFSLGIVKTGIMTEYQVEVMGYLHDVGQPYADNIDFEDYIADFRARRREEMVLEGNSYLLPEEFVKTSGLFKHTDGLTPDFKNFAETHPDGISEDNMNANATAQEELRPMVRLMDIWIPDERIILTVPEEGNGDRIMRTVEYDGPDEGPYDTLGYRFFPESILPIPPVFGVLGLNSIINRLVGKMNVQAQREKKILLYELGSADEAELINAADDGGKVGVRAADAVKEVEFGGVSETNFSFLSFLEQQYSIAGGNLYTIGGRDVQAETLGQEQMLQANASRQLQDMVFQVHEFTKNVVNKLAWYLWSDPFISIPLVKRIGEFNLSVSFTPDEREGDFLDYTFDIEPYSMSMLSPEQRYQKLLQLISQVVLPTVEIAASQGSMLNVDELVKEAARYLDVRNMDKWWHSAMPTEASPNPYQPLSGSGQPDGRFGGGKTDAAKEPNSQQHSARTANETHSADAPGSKQQKPY